MNILELSAAALAGVFTWTFLEYAIHNWVGHLGRGKTEPSREHLKHHVTPDYFSPKAKKLTLAVPVLSALGALATLLFTLPLGMTYALGVGLGWLSYEVMHRRIHVKAPRNAYGRWARRNHLHHHFASTRKNHGVTTPLWDMVFGTYQPAPTVRVPRRHAGKFPWLLAEGETLKVSASVARDFVVV